MEPVALLTSDEPPTNPVAPVVRKHRRRALIEWAAIIIVAVLVSFLLRTFAFQTFFIPSGSMEPTLQVGDRIIVNKLSVTFGTIHMGDIVVFKAPPAENCGEPVTDLASGRELEISHVVLADDGDDVAAASQASRVSAARATA